MSKIIQFPCRVRRRRSLLFAALVAILLFSNSNAQELQPLRFGAILPLSGPSAVYGDWARRGLELALSEAAEARQRDKLAPLVLTIDDNEFQPAKSLTLFHAFDAGGALAVFSTASPIAMVLAPVANRRGIPLIDVSAATPQYSSPNDYTFRTAVLAQTLIERLQQHLKSLPQADKLGGLVIESEYGQGMLEAFKRGWTREFAAFEWFKPGEADIRAQAAKLRAAGAQVLWLVSQVRESGAILRQLAQQLPGVTIITDCYSVEAPELVTSAAGAAEGVIYAAPACLLSTPSPLQRHFTALYQKTYNSEPSYFAAQAFDAGLAAAAALGECPAATRRCLRDALARMDIEGVCGRIKFDQNGDVRYPVVLKKILNGKFVVLRGER